MQKEKHRKRLLLRSIRRNFKSKIGQCGNANRSSRLLQTALILLTLAGGLFSIGVAAAGALLDINSKQVIQRQTTQTQPVRMHLFQQSITWFGQVESRHSIPLLSRVAGRIVSLKVRDESSVHVGDILFELAGTAVESRITDLKQQRRQANRELEITKKNLRLVRRKKQQHLAINEQVNAAKNALAQAESHISRVRQNLISLASGMRIIAPTEGIFTARSVQVGQYIKAGTQLARIVDVHHLRIRATLFPPANITSLVGQHAVIHAAHSDIAATVTAMMPETTAEGGMQVWIHSDAVQKLKPGMSLSGNILLPHRAVTVLKSAIARDDAGHAFVFIRDENKWRKQQIITGLRDQQWVEIRNGLRAGDQVASQGAYELLYHDFSSTYHEPD